MLVCAVAAATENVTDIVEWLTYYRCAAERCVLFFHDLGPLLRRDQQLCATLLHR